MASRARRAEVDRLRAELDANRPYLPLAQQIHEEIARVAGDPSSDLGELADALGRWPREARDAAVIAAFAELPATTRWEVLARLFDDDDLRAVLAAEHARRAAEARCHRHGLALAARVAERGLLDTAAVEPGQDVVLGLFRAADVRGVLGRGSAVTSIARRLVVRVTDEPAQLLVIEDVFNPARGLFVTAEYDETTWRAERLEPYEVVALGAARAGGGFEPLIYPGGRLDVRTAHGVRTGRLHTGCVTVGGVDLFVPSTQVRPTQVPSTQVPSMQRTSIQKETG